MSDSPERTGTTESARGISRETGPFFRVGDKVAFVIASLMAFAGYWYTLAPSVTLEDSGGFLTAAHNLGVPHPPGYPVWTMLAWIWQWIIPFGSVAWRVNLMSAFFGALAVGFAALLISKSGRVMASRCGFLQPMENGPALRRIVLASSVSASLILAFSPVMWSQSVITEVYALDAFFLMATLVLLYRWSFETERRGWLYLAAFVWGVSLTNHQTLVLLTVAFPTFVWLADRKLGRDMLAPILWVIVLGVFKMVVTPGSLFHQGSFSAVWILAHGVGAGVWLYLLWKESSGLLTLWRQVLATYAAVILGLALYGYLPLSSATNPPMNWGYTRTATGFLHHFTRGQLEKVHTERTALQFWGQVNMYFDDLKMQFNIVYALIALVALFFYRDLAREDQRWLVFLLIAFLFLGLDYIFFSNPSFERQKQFTDRVFFLPCHCLYALWIGYGLILGAGYLFSEKPQLQGAALPIAVVVLALPIVSVVMNWADNEERGHDFGYQFGYRMFKPGGGYPEMEKGAILFGGTDAGRFVPTYMIYVESQVAPRAKTQLAKYPESGTFDRRDVYILTQNALAERTYLHSARDHYGSGRPDPKNPETLQDRSGWQGAFFDFAWRGLGREAAYPREAIWVPGENEFQMALQQYLDELRIRPRLPGEDVRVEGGRVSVQGLASIMAVNGYVIREIFDHNKDQHAFYIEESYTIPWLYPYLEPYGIILKINRDPLAQITPEMIARDRAYWDALFESLHDDPRFNRDDVAEKTFSKLRSAIGGLYAFRQMVPEAEYAYKQAIALCPDGPDGNFHLAQLYVEAGRFDDGVAVLEEYQRHDRYNLRIAEVIRAIRELKRQTGEERELERQYAAQPGDLPLALLLIDSYAGHRRTDAIDAVVGSLLARPVLPVEIFLQIAQRYLALGRVDRAIELLTVMTQRYSQSQMAWYNLGVVQCARRNCDAAIAALERAVALDDAEHHVRDTIRRDSRLDNCRQDPRFQQIMGQQSNQPPSSVTLPGGITITH
jgi:tetratricopeptide (TPR) repeat protein